MSAVSTSAITESPRVDGRPSFRARSPRRVGGPHAQRPGVPARFRGHGHPVTAAISLYGYYCALDTNEPRSSPLAYDGTDAPPFFVAHGDHDTLVLVDGARLFVERRCCTSPNPVVYAELPGAQHSFDRFHSIRVEIVVDAIHPW